MLHRVRPAAAKLEFAPNRILEVTPEFLETAIRHVRENGFDIVTLDEARERLLGNGRGRRFVCFTFDDGYRDNLDHAFPVFRKYGAPFAVYVCTSLIEGRAIPWWYMLEDIVRSSNDVRFAFNGRELRYRTASLNEKHRTYSEVYWMVRGADPDVRGRVIDQWISRYGVDPAAICASCALSWNQVRELAGSGLVTIGAHTVTHPILSQMRPADVRREIVESRERIAEETGSRPLHFAYPFGDAISAGAREFEIVRELGFETATTTRKGMIFPEHADRLTALPRLSLNGDYQRERHLSALLSGIPFALMNRFRQVGASY